MPRPQRERRVALPEFERDYDQMVKTKEGQVRLLDFVRLLCTFIDEAVGQGDTWINIGTTRDKTLANITVHEQGATIYATGATLDELLSAADSL